MVTWASSEEGTSGLYARLKGEKGLLGMINFIHIVKSSQK